MPVELVEPPPNALQSVRNIAGPLVAPVGKMVIVVIFTIVILIKREDLRNRVLRLLGRGRLPRATQAFDDAAERVTRYLRMQFLVNTTVRGTDRDSVFISSGCRAHCFGGRWRGCCASCRTWDRSWAARCRRWWRWRYFPGWRYPLLCLGLFLVIEMMVAYAVEPWLYGTHTGVSSLAILVSAAFWTTLWGPVGLVLSTPLTVCLLVLGRHAPQLEFLYVILGDEPVLEPEAELYQRLLALGPAGGAGGAWTRPPRDNRRWTFTTDILVPALRLSEEDRHRGRLDQDRERFHRAKHERVHRQARVAARGRKRGRGIRAARARACRRETGPTR